MIRKATYIGFNFKIFFNKGKLTMNTMFAVSGKWLYLYSNREAEDLPIVTICHEDYLNELDYYTSEEKIREVNTITIKDDADNGTPVLLCDEFYIDEDATYILKFYTAIKNNYLYKFEIYKVEDSKS